MRKTTIVVFACAFAFALTLVGCSSSSTSSSAASSSTDASSSASSSAETQSSSTASQASALVKINTDGMGQIAWAYAGEKVEFDDNQPLQSAVVNDAAGQTITIAAKADDGWKFAKWTRDGADFSTEATLETSVDGDAEYVAVFAADEGEKSSKAASSEGSPLSEDQANAIIQDNGYGDALKAEQVKLDDGVWYWKVTASHSDGSVHFYYVDPSGTVSDADEDGGVAPISGGTTTKNKLSENDVEKIIWEQGLGDIQSMDKVTLDDGVQYWKVVTRGANGNTSTFIIDPKGNVSDD